MAGFSHILTRSRLPQSLLAAGLLSLGAGAIAQPPGPAPTSGPGAQGAKSSAPAPETRADIKARLEARFDRMDANHDGKIDAKDAQARHAARIARMFAEADTDKNGSISEAEFAAMQKRRERAEHALARLDRRGPARAMMFHRGPESRFLMRGRLPFAPPPGGFRAAGPERNRGEALTRSAFVDRGLARFDRIDTDHDGKISPAERAAARRDMHRPHSGKTPPAPPTPSSSGQ